jgi:hypothetical protein
MIKIGIDTNLISHLTDKDFYDTKVNPIRDADICSLVNIFTHHSNEEVLKVYTSWCITAEIIDKKLTGNEKQMSEILRNLLLPNTKNLATKQQREEKYKKLDSEFGHYFRKKDRDKYILIDYITCGFDFLITYDGKFISKCKNEEIKQYITVDRAPIIEKELIKEKSYKIYFGNKQIHE